MKRRSYVRRKGRRRYVAILIAGVVGAAGAIWWFARERGSEPRLVERDSQHRVVRARAPIRATSDEPEGAEASWLVEPGVEGRRIAGQVVADGRGLAGARVQLRAEFLLASGALPPEAITDAEGRFDLGVQAPTSYAVVASADGYRTGVVRLDLRNPRGEPPPEEVVVELARCDGWVFGEVRDVYGGIVPDGTVSVAGWLDERSYPLELFAVPIEADGSFALCRPGAFEHLWVKVPGFGSVWLRDPMPPGGWDVRLVPAGSVSGTVVDPGGDGLEGARVVLLATVFGVGAPIAQTSHTGPDGSFRIESVLPGGYEVAADHGRHVVNRDWPTVTVAPGEDVSGVTIELRACRSMAGIVLLDRDPVAGARVFGAYTQRDGSFVIGCAPFESFEIEVRGHDVLNPTVPDGREDIDDLVVRVQARASVSGRVTAGGEPVAGAVVAVGDPDVARFLSLPVGEGHLARTDAGGRYELTGLPAGTHRVSALDPASRRRSKTVTVDVRAAEPLEPLGLELEPAAAVAGIVVDREGAPVAHVGVRLTRVAGEGSRPGSDTEGATTGEDGFFRVVGLDLGRYRVCLGWCGQGKSDPRYVPLDGAPWPEIEVSPERREPEVRLVIRGRAGLSIGGHVRFDDGAPVPFAVVRTGRRDAQARADEHGAFVLSDLVEGDYELEAIALDGSKGTASGVAAGREGAAIAIARAGAIRGSVVGGAGSCSVSATPAEQGGTGRGRHAAGVREFNFDGVSPGDYRVEARCAEGLGAESVSVSPAEVATVELRVGAGGTIRGIARHFPGGDPIAGVSCRAGGTEVTAGAAGEFELAPVLAGAIRVTCDTWRAAALSAGVAEATVEAGRATEVEVHVVEIAGAADIARTRSFLGAELERVADEDPALFAFVAVAPGGAAAAAGIEDGDALLSVAGASARGAKAEAARAYLMSRPPGASLQLTVGRAGHTHRVVLTLASSSSDP